MQPRYFTNIDQTILLAGGLGGNDYLYKFLGNCGIPIIRAPPPQPWSSIARGGVHRARQELRYLLPDEPDDVGLNEGVISRVARLSYGIAKFVDFVEGLHEEEDRYTMDSVGRVVAVNQMAWYLKQARLVRAVVSRYC